MNQTYISHRSGITLLTTTSINGHHPAKSIYHHILYVITPPFNDKNVYCNISIYAADYNYTSNHYRITTNLMNIV